MTRTVTVGTVKIGGGSPVSIQSMLNTDTKDVSACLAQLNRLAAAGCDICRLAVYDMEAAAAFGEIKKQSPLPLVADIHFDHRLALAAMDAGADKIRLNPGNIGGEENVYAVTQKAKALSVPIRIGVNGGSLEKELLKKHGGPTPDAMCESALGHVKLLEDCGFYDIVISIKSSSVPDTVRAYEKMRTLCDYPLHIGITEAGTAYSGVIRSAAGLGSLLLSGIGDTLRVSLTADPAEEVRCAKELLSCLGLRGGPRLISCPTCGRTKIDLIPLASEVEKRLAGIDKNITVAVMGCVVNGPGEATGADVGIAGGDGCAVLFKKGKIIKKVPENEILDALMQEIETL